MKRKLTVVYLLRLQKLQDPCTKIKLRNHDGHFFPPITTPLLVIRTWQARNIISIIRIRLNAKAICYLHRGWLTIRRRIRSTLWSYKIYEYYSVIVHRIITKRLQWRCHYHLWTKYMYIRLGGRRFATPTVVGYKNTSKIVHPLVTKKYTTQLYVHRIITIRLQWLWHRVRWPIYKYSRLGFTSLANRSFLFMPTKLPYYMHKILIFLSPTCKHNVVIHMIICMIYVKYLRIRIVIPWSVSMEWGDILLVCTYITINHFATMIGVEQLNWFNNILECEDNMRSCHGVYLRKWYLDQKNV